MIRSSVCFALLLVLVGVSADLVSCGGGGGGGGNNGNGGSPSVVLNSPTVGATQLSGHAYNVDTNTTKIVVYALTNQWYVQPLVNAPFTNISSDGTWTSSTNAWNRLVILLVNPANYMPAATEITNPALDSGVLAYSVYPAGPISLNFAGYTWGIKVTGTSSGDAFDPGPNLWSDSSSVVSVGTDGLHLRISNVDGKWQCGEVYLTQSLGYGTYTVQVSSHVDQLDRNTVAAPLFIYAAPGEELDNEYSGAGGLVPRPYNGQFVVQPYTVPGNIAYFTQPSSAQFTIQMQWSASQVIFSAWNGWAGTPTAGTLIYQWTYRGRYIPPSGQDRVHINIWLLNGSGPVNGAGDEIVINSFAFQAPTVASVHQVFSGESVSSVKTEIRQPLSLKEQHATSISCPTPATPKLADLAAQMAAREHFSLELQNIRPSREDRGAFGVVNCLIPLDVFPFDCEMAYSVEMGNSENPGGV